MKDKHLPIYMCKFKFKNSLLMNFACRVFLLFLGFIALSVRQFYVFQQVWPVLSRACDKYQGDVRITERCCRCIRFVIRCLGKQSADLLTPLVSQVRTSGDI